MLLLLLSSAKSLLHASSIVPLSKPESNTVSALPTIAFSIPMPSNTSKPKGIIASSVWNTEISLPSIVIFCALLSPNSILELWSQYSSSSALLE